MEMISILSCLAIFCHLVVGFPEGFHQNLTDEQIHELFSVHRESIPELKYARKYELVDIHHRQYLPNRKLRRNERGLADEKVISLTAFGKNIDLLLEPNNHVLYGSKTPIYRSSMVGRKISYQRQPMPNIRSYVDEKNKAAVTLHEDESGRTHVNGVVGHNLKIHSIPSSMFQSLSRHNISDATHLVMEVDSSKIAKRSKREILHRGTWNVIDTNDLNMLGKKGSKIKDTNSNKENEILKKPDVDHSKFEVVKRGDKTGIPMEDLEKMTVYPEILVVLDHETASSYKKTEDLIVYMVSFWNGVDLRYRTLDKPQIRLNIAGIIIPENALASVYLNKRFEAIKCGTAMCKVMIDSRDVFPIESYDIVVGFIHATELPFMPKVSGLNITSISSLRDLYKNYL